ncbi:spermidine/putrescine ABC transporter permease PotC [Scandinavium goeteborgense]|uniref:spermidine/putrescine ABC transporter permease PotC n=2 Tax=Scandinavium goeteborgense TaxID=1851514 RepID=UPI000F691DCD|nr:spermidine/putrescine ABC transporter permease PotC [Scandinavium goeteborgense]QKN81775.1 spermidine/putrescine ABC transporter permease PotC [Scandinavium goeteborgense]
MMRWISWLLMGGLYAWLYIPIGILIVNSFNSSAYGIDWGGFTFEWYDILRANDSLLQAAGHSLIMATLSATCATLIGTLIAIALHRYRSHGQSFIKTMLFIVTLSPDIVMAISLMALFILFGMSLGFTTLLFSHITFCLPFVVLTVRARLAGFDPQMTEAAKDLGASEWIIMKMIIFPLIFPAVASGWLLSFTLSMDDVVISSFVTGASFEILPLKIYSMVKVGISPEVNALATLLLVVSLALITISQFLLNRKDSVTRSVA